jgi:hypothetical protein
MSIDDGLICGRQAHNSCSNNQDSRHRIKILGSLS